MRIHGFICLVIFLTLVASDDSTMCRQNDKLVQNDQNICGVYYTQCNQTKKITISTCFSLKCKILIGSDCYYYSYVYLDLNRCMRDCCGVQKPSIQTYEYQDYRKCLFQSAIQQKKMRPVALNEMAIILGSILGFIFIVTVIICICCRQRIRKIWDQRDPENSYAFNNKHNGRSSKVQSNQINYIFQQSNENISFSKEQECTICLSGSTEIKTKCGHWFHLRCLTSWLLKNFKCPNCVSQQISPMKIICKDCQRPYAQISLQKMNQWRHIKKQLNNLKCKICNQKQK